MKMISEEYCLIKPFKFQVHRKIIRTIPKRSVLLKPIIAGICGSEILYFKGEKEEGKLKNRLPMCLLHEGVAKVIDVGKEVTLEKGVHVVVNPMIPCGQCIPCRSGIGENFCQNSKYMASTFDGIARTFFIYPRDRIIPIPRGIDLGVAALTEPLSIALNALEVADIKRNQKIGVIGDGTMGYLVALITSSLGKIPQKNLYLFGIIDEKLSLARDFVFTVNTVKENPKVEKMNQKFDVIFEAVGGRAQKRTLDEALNLLKPGGIGLVLGLSKKHVPVNIIRLVNKGLILKGCVRSRLDHYTMIIDLLKKKSFRDKVKRIISEKKFVIQSPLDLEKAFRFADTQEGGAMTQPGRVLVYFP